LQVSAYSAFGSTEPVHDPGGERIRWFCTRLVTGRDTLFKALLDLERAEKGAGVSRVTARIVSAGELPRGCNELLEDKGFRVEARMQLGGARNLLISYIGKCAANRCSDFDDTRQEKLLLADILSQNRALPAGIIEAFDSKLKFHFEMATPASLCPADIDRLVCMHRKTFPTFPYDFKKKLGIMLNNPDTYWMAIVRSSLNGQVHAFSNLEVTTLKLDDGTRLCLAEYDNTMRVTCSPDHGVVSGLGGILRLQLARLAARANVDLCHAESRAGLAAINVNSYQIGMRFGGTLEKYLLISGRSDVEYTAPGRFENMNVWYLNREHHWFRKVCQGISMQ